MFPPSSSHFLINSSPEKSLSSAKGPILFVKVKKDTKGIKTKQKFRYLCVIPHLFHYTSPFPLCLTFFIMPHLLYIDFFIMPHLFHYASPFPLYLTFFINMSPKYGLYSQKFFRPLFTNWYLQ